MKCSGEGSEASEDESVNSEESEVSETEEVKEVIYGPPKPLKIMPIGKGGPRAQKTLNTPSPSLTSPPSLDNNSEYVGR